MLKITFFLFSLVISSISIGLEYDPQHPYSDLQDPVNIWIYDNHWFKPFVLYFEHREDCPCGNPNSFPRSCYFFDNGIFHIDPND